MLDTRHRADLNSLLASLEDRIQLPEEWRDYFSESGMLPTNQNESRRFVRRCIRARVVLKASAHSGMPWRFGVDGARARRVI